MQIDDLVEAVKKIGIPPFQNWLKENEITLSTSKGSNFYDKIAASVEEKVLTLEQLSAAIGEIEENSDKKITLLRSENFDELLTTKKSILSRLRSKFGILESSENWVRVKPKATPTFNYLYWDDEVLKIKYSELQFEKEFDLEREVFTKIQKEVIVLFLIDFKDELIEIRYDTPANYHSHKNSDGNFTEKAYEDYYRILLENLFENIHFEQLNLNSVVNYIQLHEKDKFRLTKGVTTISDGAKQSYSGASNKMDIRDLKEYKGAAKSGTDLWLSEDLTGWWLASTSEGQLEKDLFMRISRKTSQIRVTRGCIQKELNYGIKQIREIQKKV